MAEPKNTGDCLPAKNASRLNSGMAFRIKSTSVSASFRSEPSRSCRAGSCISIRVSELSETRSSPALKRRIFDLAMSITPAKDLPMPTGQVNGTTSIPRAFSISSINSRGRLTSRSILLMKVMSGVLRARHTSRRRKVCDSTPLAASITMSAESTAVSTR